MEKIVKVPRQLVPQVIAEEEFNFIISLLRVMNLPLPTPLLKPSDFSLQIKRELRQLGNKFNFTIRKNISGTEVVVGDQVVGLWGLPQVTWGPGSDTGPDRICAEIKFESWSLYD